MYRPPNVDFEGEGEIAMKSVVLMILAVGVAWAMVPEIAWADEKPGIQCCFAEEGASAAGCCQAKDSQQQCCAAAAANDDAAVVPARGKQQRGRGSAGNPEMRNAHTLVFNRESIKRVVEVVPGGVRTTNTTTDPELVAVLQNHPKEMSNRLKRGQHVRPWDPLFAELAKHADKVKMTYRKLENGIEVTSTSEDPEVVKLIRAHAAKVNEFVNRGRAAMREKTPLPENYEGN